MFVVNIRIIKYNKMAMGRCLKLQKEFERKTGAQNPGIWPQVDMPRVQNRTCPFQATWLSVMQMEY
jgi:hypothetical protein